MTPPDPFDDVPPTPKQVRGGPPKLRITTVGGKPMGVLNKTADEYFGDRGCRWVRVQRSASNPRALRLVGLPAADPGALKIRDGSRTISGARLRGVAPYGTDIPLQPASLGGSPLLVGFVPDDVELPPPAA